MPRQGFRRLLPDSLLGQLVLTFTLSFMIFLLISMYHAHESRVFYSVRGILGYRGRSMVEIALLMDNALPPNRAAIAERMSVRGMTVFVEDVPPTFHNLSSPLYLKESGLMTRLLNASLEEVWWSGSLSDAALTTRMERIWDDRDPHFNGPGHAAVIAMSTPRFLADITQSVQRSLGIRQPNYQDALPLYEAIAAIPLTDGNWVVFHDRVPNRPALPPVPLKGILFTEAFFILVSVFAFFLITKPLKVLTKAADNMGKDIAGAPPLPESGPREVRAGAQAFNRMQRRIRDFVDQRSSTLAAVSHDLRTPLTRMRLRVEQLDENLRAPLQKDMEELQQLIDTALDLSRSGTHEPPVNLDMASLVESIAEDRQDMGQNIRLLNPEKLAGLLPIMAPPQTVKRCLGNVLDNAVRYGGGRADIEIHDTREYLDIMVHDQGPGVPEDLLQKVFEPFFRLEPSRNRKTGGSGLGLAIARSMIRSYGGDLTLENRAPRTGSPKGLTARIRIPKNIRIRER